MLRSLVLVALVAACAATTAAPATTPTLSCFTATIPATSTDSVCKGSVGAKSFCSTSQTIADATATGLATVWNALTTTTLTAAGNITCSALGGTVIASYWTDASKVCDVPSCDSTCGSTATASTATLAPYCCSYVKSQINAACSGVTMDVTPTTTAAATFAGAACSTDSNCRSSASTVAYSVFAALIAALLALAQL
jgi:hypothetical protein